MALISCPKCGKQISDKAKVCTGCGCSLKKTNVDTKIIICPECNAQLLNTEELCPNCGYPMNNLNKKYKLNKKALITICIAVGITVTIGIGSIIYNSTPVQNHIVKTNQNKAQLKASKLAFEEAKKMENEKNYEKAIKKYKAVIKEDKSYETAKNKIAEIGDIYKNQIISEAENYSTNKQYTEAIQTINKGIAVLGETTEFANLIQEYNDLKSFRYAKVQVVEKTSMPKDKYNYIFQDYVKFVFDITNNSDKTIKGIEGILTIKDLFGKDFKTLRCDFTGINIEPNITRTITDKSYDCNPFRDEDNQLYTTDFSDLQFVYDITNIVYTDGTSVAPE